MMRLTTINLHALMLFYYVALTGSVTSASKKLNISNLLFHLNFEVLKGSIMSFYLKKRQEDGSYPFGQKLIKPTEIWGKLRSIDYSKSIHDTG
ncbi:hypothetical protein ACI7RC_09480 [Brevibacillus sp. B_LB10_24]|uniref:hypothetical protein n=1 Tax=Brevibacillus sp. B_LB10_24 TaxID=3380645 RepID=UPI0038BDFD36